MPRPPRPPPSLLRLVARSGLDPVADRMLANLLAYASSTRPPVPQAAPPQSAATALPSPMSGRTLHAFVEAGHTVRWGDFST